VLSRPALPPAKHSVCLVGLLVKVQKATVIFFSVCLSVRTEHFGSLSPAGRISVKFNTRVFFENLSRKLKFHLSLTRRIVGTL
jgi:hypothetical protein